jgi:hypothetical protein
MNREHAGARRTSGFERRDHVEERSRPSALDAISPRIEAFVPSDIIRVPTEPVSPTLADSDFAEDPTLAEPMTRLREHFVESDGVRIHWADVGQRPARRRSCSSTA